MLRMLVLLALGLVSASLLGCSSLSAPGGAFGGPAGGAALIAQLPPLPAPHAASAQVDFTQLGMETAFRDLNAWDEGTSLRLASSSFSICWGVWGFSNAANPTSCRVDFSGVAGAQAYFAISDYTKGAWEIRGPLSGPQQLLTLGDPRYADGNGNCYIAAIACQGASILVDQLVLTTDVAPVAKTLDVSGGYTSLAMVDGTPAISYYDDVNDNLRYVHATDLFGGSWGTPLTLDSAGDTGRFTSLKVVSGNPAVAYYDVTVKRLRYVRSLDADGTAWGAPVTVASPVTTGEHCSLEVVAGAPAISYYDFDNGELRYVRATDSTGAAWGLPVSPDSNGNTGFYSSLKVIGGFPAISYRNGSASQLWYVRGTNAEGTAWASPVLVSGDDNAGNYSSLAEVNGAPAIAYYASSMGDLEYVRATDALGDAWGAPQQLDDAEDKGSYCSLAVVGGVPAISYHCGLHGDLRYIQALDADGAAWGSEQLLDESSNITGRDTSLCDVYGHPGVSYFDLTNGNLQYMWGF